MSVDAKKKFDKKKKSHFAKKPKETMAPRKSRKSIEIYRSNTFVNNIPLRNGMELSHNPEDINEMYLHIAKYKTITTIIEKHLRDPKNIFCQLYDIFEKYYINKYTPVLEDLRLIGYESRAKKHVSGAVEDLQ